MENVNTHIEREIIMNITEKVKINNPNSVLHNKTGVITGESNLIIDSSKGRRLLIRFADSPFTFGMEECYLVKV